MSRFPKDLLERAFWTGAEAAVALVTVNQLDLDNWLIVPIGIALAALKALIARRVGKTDSASTIPSI